jgi:HPt (histidine-containing phosphotransfer) domain-containing protein
LKPDPVLACRSGLAEAKAMRALDRRIDAAYRTMHRMAEQARATPARSLAGALARIELGLKVQGPFDWRDHALELIEDGIAEAQRLAV